MCGIVGLIGSRPAAPILLEALRRLEYRGYDSAGIATLVNGHIDRRRAAGKLGNLAEALAREPLTGTTGIGHTRWATHGAPTQSNAHPHGTARVSVVHNGIIENHAELRTELEAAGQEFSTETDTETVAQLVDLNLQRGMDPIAAAGHACGRLQGAYALAMIFAGHPELMIGARHGAPLAVGYGDVVFTTGSDALALAPLTRRIAYLNDGDWVAVGKDSARFFDASGAEVKREIKQTALSGAAVGKGNFRHFMEKELHEHPAVLGDTLRRMISPSTRAVALPNLPFDLARIPRVTISACGSAFYAGMVARTWFEQITRLPTDVDVASEFRYRTPPMTKGGLGLLVSQSGETADTLAALRYMHEQGQHVLSVLNVPESSMARESDVVLETVAGPEIGVASTKAFTAQLAVLACLALAAGRARGSISAAEEAAMTAALLEVPSRAAEVLEHDQAIQRLAARIAEARDVLGQPRLLLPDRWKARRPEEVDIHAEGYAAGEMKLRANRADRPQRAGDRDRAERAVVREDRVQFAGGGGARRPRGGVQRRRGAEKLKGIAAETVVLPRVDPFVAPILYAIPVQLLAYHVAVLKGTDVDQPRNLAKSVTVE